ncbi:MAG: hypothetical protein CMG55_06195 [Candidatus Marinimicrobia bacterium]|nr:hypothetical protein [Candidatus Neomarinimicrobiota bacterium]
MGFFVWVWLCRYRTMMWIKRMLLGGFIVNIIYIALMLLQPDLSILINTLISGTLTGLLMLFLIIKEHILKFYQLNYLISLTLMGFFVWVINYSSYTKPIPKKIANMSIPISLHFGNILLILKPINYWLCIFKKTKSNNT